MPWAARAHTQACASRGMSRETVPPRASETGPTWVQPHPNSLRETGPCCTPAGPRKPFQVPPRPQSEQIGPVPREPLSLGQHFSRVIQSGGACLAELGGSGPSVRKPLAILVVIRLRAGTQAGACRCLQVLSEAGAVGSPRGSSHAHGCAVGIPARGRPLCPQMGSAEMPGPWGGKRHTRTSKTCQAGPRSRETKYKILVETFALGPNAAACSRPSLSVLPSFLISLITRIRHIRWRE